MPVSPSDAAAPGAAGGGVPADPALYLPVVAPAAEAIGIRLGDDRDRFVRTRLERAMRESGATDFREYTRLLADGLRGRLERDRLAACLTVGETYFFRDREVLEQIAPVCRAILARRVVRMLRVLSAGCSTGDEAYSVAMLLADAFGGDPTVSFRVTGWDVNPSAVVAARAGLYPLHERALQQVDDAALARHFEKVDDRFVRPRAAIRERVSFEIRNILDPGYEGPPFDVILCRNVLIYFSPEARERACTNLARLLPPDGVAFFAAADHFTVEGHGFTHAGGMAERGYRKPGAATVADHREARAAACRTPERAVLTPVREPLLRPCPPDDGFPAETIAGIRVVRLSGDLAAGGAEEGRFGRALERLRLAAATRVVLDLDAVTGLDQTFVGRLIRFLKDCRREGGDVRLAAAKPAVLDFLARNLVDRFVDVRRDAAAAAAAFDATEGGAA